MPMPQSHSPKPGIRHLEFVWFKFIIIRAMNYKSQANIVWKELKFGF